jgi:hypothetical protein
MWDSHAPYATMMPTAPALAQVYRGDRGPCAPAQQPAPGSPGRPSSHCTGAQWPAVSPGG